MNSIDTNVLIYAFDPSETLKHEVATKLLARALRGSWPIAAQVYGEFFSATVRKQIATRAMAFDIVTTWKRAMPALESSLAAHETALRLATQHQLQYWDALIIATCAEHGVKKLYTEDAPSVLKPLGVVIENPFKLVR